MDIFGLYTFIMYICWYINCLLYVHSFSLISNMSIILLKLTHKSKTWITYNTPFIKSNKMFSSDKLFRLCWISSFLVDINSCFRVCKIQRTFVQVLKWNGYPACFKITEQLDAGTCASNFPFVSNRAAGKHEGRKTVGLCHLRVIRYNE